MARKNKSGLICITMILLCTVFASGADQPGSQNSAPGSFITKGETAVQDINEINSGALLFYLANEKRYVKAPDLSMSVDIEVTGIVAKTRFTQVFSNPHKEWLEATYVFPLPETATVNKLRLVLADRVIEGTIMEKEEAKKVYEQAKENGEQAALLEEERPNMFMTSVANIPPLEKVTVELEYIDTLAYDVGSFSLRFPLVITPRYNPKQSDAQSQELSAALGVMSKTKPPASMNNLTKVKAKTFDDAISPSPILIKPLLYPGEGLRNPVDIRITLKPGFDLETVASLYHQVKASKTGDNRYTITLASGPVPADRDFVLVWKPFAKGVSDVSAFIEEKNGSFYSLVMVIPPPEKRFAARARREVIFIFDHSGSMYGASLSQAKTALSEALRRLEEGDSFNLIAFNDSYASVFDDCVEANAGNKSKALDFVRGLAADGGTEMKQALEAALLNTHDSGKLRQIIFITDGAVSNEAELLGVIRNGLGEGRLFTVGIGSAPNTFFMKKAAEIGRGSCTYIGDNAEVAEKMSALFEKIKNPVLTDMKIVLENNAGEAVPNRIPDLYFGEPVIVLSKLSDPGGIVRFSGSFTESGVGPVKRFSRDIDMSTANRGAGIASLWASKKIESLLDSMYEGEPEETVKPRVLALALEHEVVSPYTSLVAVEHRTMRPKDENLATGEVPQNPPHGFSLQQGPDLLGKAGTLTDLALGIGILSLFASLMCFIVVYRRTNGKKSRIA